MMAVFTVLLALQIPFASSLSIEDDRSALMPREAVAAKRTAAQKVCRDRVSLRHAPAGVTIGFLRRGARVIVTLYARRHRWAYVLSADGHGWLLTSALCRRRS
jgi:hypothetical protein